MRPFSEIWLQSICELMEEIDYYFGVQIKNVAEVLPQGFSTPDLEMLQPTEKSYTCLLLQPSGPIFADETRIGSFESEAAGKKGHKFFELSHSKQAHLAVTPEYFLPWVTLQSLIEEKITPHDTALWIVGCESCTAAQLEEFKKRVGEKCVVIHEAIDSGPEDGIFSPIALLFNSIDSSGNKKLVVLVQFKTFPSRDSVFFEERVLRRGNQIYQFKGKTGHLSVSTIICSDALNLSPENIGLLVDRSTVIHLQLNPDPRHLAFRNYRTNTFLKDSKSSECQIVCLNWAHSIVQHGEGVYPISWKNIGGSAFYCSADNCSAKDETILPNHEKGMYYTWLKERRHALLLNYEEAIFEFRVPKILTTGMAVMANRNGPLLLERYIWSSPSSDWAVSARPADADFEILLDGYPDAKTALTSILGSGNCLQLERILALSAGSITGKEYWYEASNVDSFQMEMDEIVNRITMAQDKSEKASKFRHDRISRIEFIQHAINTIVDWPPQVKGLNKNAKIHWNSDRPYFNVLTDDNQPTLVVHLGEAPLTRALENVTDMLCRLLRLQGNTDDKRLCIVYRKNDKLMFATIRNLIQIDDAIGDPTEIMDVEPLNAHEESNND